MRKKDYFLIAAVILSAVILYALFNIFSDEGEYAVIISNGEEYARLPLDKDTQISVDGKNIVTIENGEIYVSYADCPDKLCMKQGKIKSEGKTIVCLPNKMTVKAEGKKK